MEGFVEAYATGRKVAGFDSRWCHLEFSLNSFCRTTALGSTQLLTAMSTRFISCGCKGGRCVGPTILSFSCAYDLKFWEPQTPEAERANRGLYRNIYCICNNNLPS